MNASGGEKQGEAGANRVLLEEAVRLALAGDWDLAHKAVQGLDNDRRACWIHGILHRIEGDLENARYWYRKAGRPFPSEDPREELKGIF